MARFLEFLFVAFDTEVFAEYGPYSESVWIDEVQGGGALISLVLEDEVEALVAFNVTSLHIGSVPESVPEPTTMLLMGLGIAGLGFTRRRLL